MHFRYQTQNIHTNAHHEVQQFQHWKHSVLKILLSLHNHSDQKHFDHNQQYVLHFVLVDEVTVNKTVQNTFYTLKDQFIEILVLYVLLFFQFFLPLFLWVFSVYFYSWYQDLTQSQQDTKHDDEDHTTDESEDQVESVNKLEWEEDSELETDLKREENQVGSDQCQKDVFERYAVFEVLSYTFQNQWHSGRFLLFIFLNTGLGTGIGRNWHFL